MEFTKWQGCGNDFVIVDFLDREPVDFAALAVRMCDRHFGVGADARVQSGRDGTRDVRERHPLLCTLSLRLRAHPQGAVHDRDDCGYNGAADSHGKRRSDGG